MPLAKDQHPVGDLGPCREREPPSEQKEAHHQHGGNRSHNRCDGTGPDLTAVGAVVQDRKHLRDRLICQPGAGRVDPVAA